MLFPIAPILVKTNSAGKTKTDYLSPSNDSGIKIESPVIDVYIEDGNEAYWMRLTVLMQSKNVVYVTLSVFMQTWITKQFHCLILYTKIRRLSIQITH